MNKKSNQSVNLHKKQQIMKDDAHFGHSQVKSRCMILKRNFIYIYNFYCVKLRTFFNVV